MNFVRGLTAFITKLNPKNHNEGNHRSRLPKLKLTPEDEAALARERSMRRDIIEADFTGRLRPDESNMSKLAEQAREVLERQRDRERQLPEGVSYRGKE